MTSCSGKRNFRPDLVIGAVLILVTSAVYVGVAANDFINYDDPSYVWDNAHVAGGLNWDSVWWALTTPHSSNWHPLTWFSHMLDCSLFGLRPGWHHLVNAMFHTVNVLLLFLAFRQMTGDPWRSGFVAALFALHPLHVESVAWLSERKDVLSAMFWMLTLIAYGGWVRRGSRAHYLFALLMFLLGLTAKPVLVTLPFVLLLLDIWPLNRLASAMPTEGGGSWHRLGRLMLEKLPFLVLSAISCIITYKAQQSTGAVQSAEIFPLDVRIANGVVTYMLYLKNLVFPLPLSVYYPHPGMRSLTELGAAIGVLAALTYLAVKYATRHAHLLTGWLWYLGTLVPMIGIVQVGQQAMADRYTYIPLIGISVMIAWSIPNRIGKMVWGRMGLLAVSLAVFGGMAVLSMRQIALWKDGITLFKHALVATGYDNAMAHSILGHEYGRLGMYRDGIAHFHAALRINPFDFDNRLATGNIYLASGNYEAAVEQYQIARRLDPGSGKVHNNLGIARMKLGQYRKAEANFRRSQQLLPNEFKAYANLGDLMLETGRPAEAVAQFQRALAIDPDIADLHSRLGLAWLQLGDPEKAIDSLSAALKLNPRLVPAHENMARALFAAGRDAEARGHFEKARALKNGRAPKSGVSGHPGFQFADPQR